MHFATVAKVDDMVESCRRAEDFGRGDARLELVQACHMAKYASFFFLSLWGNHCEG